MLSAYGIDPIKPPNELTMIVNTAEMIKVTEEGFWVRGVKVEQGPNEAQEVYQAFREFLVWSGLTRQY